MISILIFSILTVGQGVIDTADVNAHDVVSAKRIGNSRNEELRIPDWAQVKTATLRSHLDHVDLELLLNGKPEGGPHEALELEVLFSDESETRRVIGGCVLQPVGTHEDARLARRLLNNTMAAWDEISRLRFLAYKIDGDRIVAHLPKSWRQIVLYSVQSSWHPDRRYWKPVPAIIGSGSSWLRPTGALSRARVSFRQLAREDIAKIR